MEIVVAVETDENFFTSHILSRRATTIRCRLASAVSIVRISSGIANSCFVDRMLDFPAPRASCRLKGEPREYARPMHLRFHNGEPIVTLCG